MVEDLAELLFEFASADRLKIISEIETEPMKLSEVARKLSITATEASRQLGRLTDARLIEKNPEGAYRLTSFGRTTLSLVPSFDFMYEERNYLLSHDMASLPPGYLQRIGELAQRNRIDGIDDLIGYEVRVVEEAEEYLWYMVDQLFGHSVRRDWSEFSGKVLLRTLIPKSLSPDAFGPLRTKIGDRFEVGVVDEVKVALVMNEKLAAVAFPTLDGRIDYGRGFTGDSPRFHKWCFDLYTSYWNNSRKR